MHNDVFIFIYFNLPPTPEIKLKIHACPDDPGLPVLGTTDVCAVCTYIYDAV